jgi:superfamily II RNA helicase
LSSSDELVLTEMVFDGALGGLGDAPLAALLSAFVWREKGEGGGGKV